MEQANASVQKAISGLVDDVDKSCLRKVQLEMFRCSARCCENTDMSLHQVQDCVNRCNAPAQHADQYLQSELQGFQSRLERCALDCKDKASDTLGPNSSEKDKQVASTNMEKCVINCVSSHLELLPAMFKRIKQTLAAQQKN